MTKYHKHSVADLARVTPIARVTDAQIWSLLVTPMVKALLGRVLSHKVELRETTAGDFPGDEVANLNDHRLYGGQSGFVRYPYLYSLYKTEYGALIVKRDGVKFEALGWFGDIEKKRAELIFRVALRDRRYDGTKAANDTALVDYPYDDPVLNGRLPVEASTVELSVYGFLPSSRAVDATGNKEYDLFLEKPFLFISQPEKFLAYFNDAWKSNRAPGQNAAPIPDVSRLVPPLFEKIARRCGYDFIEVAPSHYHVAMWAKSVGYRVTNPANAQVMLELSEGLERIRKAGIPLTRPQQSWVCVVQSLPAELIPAGLNLNGPVWPQDNIGPQNLWMNKPLNEKAAKLLP